MSNPVTNPLQAFALSLLLGIGSAWCACQDAKAEPPPAAYPEPPGCPHALDGEPGPQSMPDCHVHGGICERSHPADAPAGAILAKAQPAGFDDLPALDPAFGILTRKTLPEVMLAGTGAGREATVTPVTLKTLLLN